MRSNRATSASSVGTGRKQGKPAASSVDVFISYSRRDTSFARDLFAFLTERGKDVWADWEDIPPSSVWRADIAAGIEGAGSVVFVVSPDSINSLNCLRELEHAKSCGKRIVPIVCREVDADGAPPLLGELNWIFARAGDNRETALAALVEAIDTDLDWVHVHTRLLVRAVEWDANGRNRSFLLRGSDLRAAELQLASHAGTKPVPTPLQTQFVLASRRAAVTRQRVTLAAVLVALAVSSALGILFLLQRNAADERARVAKSRELATSATGVLGSDPELGLILATEAVRTKPTAEAVGSLRLALVASNVRETIDAPRPLEGAALSADGRDVVAVDDHGRAYVWSLERGGGAVWDGRLSKVPGGPRWLDLYGRQRPAALAVRTRPVVENGGVVSQDFTRTWRGEADLAPSPSGRYGVATDCVESFLVAGGAKRAPLRQVKGVGGDCPPDDDFPIVRWSPDESRFVVAQQVAYGAQGTAVVSGGDASVRIFRTATGAQIAQLVGHSGYVDAVAFSPDGNLVATGGEDGTARIWDAATGAQQAVLLGNRAAVTSVLFTKDGNRVVTASGDGTTRVWSVAAGLPQLLDGVSGGISSNGEYAATVSRRGGISLWRSADGKLVARASGPRGSEQQVSVADDGSIVVVDGAPVDTRAHKRLPSFDPGLGAASLSADGKWALDTGAGTKLRSVSTGRDVHWLSTDRLDEDGVFSLDDRLVATIGEGDIEGGDASDEVRLWDVKTGKHVHSFHTGGSPWATTVAVSPDDTLLAAGDVDGFVSIWATDGRFARVARVRAQDATVTALAFDPGSDVLATGGDDGIARLWDARTGNELVQLSGHTGVVHSIAFSPDGSLVVTAGSDRTVRVWDVTTGTRLLVLHTPAAVVHAALAGTSAWIVAQLANGRIARFACDACGSTADLLARAAQRTTRSLTPGERRRYLHQS